MARLIKRFRRQPYAVIIGSATTSICGCGLSATLPFCDGTHATTEAEDPGKLHWYDEAGQLHTTADAYAGIRSDKQPQEA